MAHVMLDIETLSTAPNAVIISIGAVKFTASGSAQGPAGAIDESTFYERIDPASCTQAGLHTDPATVAWWRRQSPEARKVLDAGGGQLEDVLRRFLAWAGPRPHIWGNGSDFDNVIVASACKAVGITRPWSYAQNRCYRTVKALAPTVALNREGTHHNALDDACTQAEHLIRVLAHLQIPLG